MRYYLFNTSLSLSLSLSHSFPSPPSPMHTFSHLCSSVEAREFLESVKPTVPAKENVSLISKEGLVLNKI